LNREQRIWWGKNGNNVPRFKRFLVEVKQGVVPARPAWATGTAAAAPVPTLTALAASNYVLSTAIAPKCVSAVATKAAGDTRAIAPSASVIAIHNGDERH
jgi:hypothetical protein